MKILITYAFCTFGGVERVILNRLEAFRNYDIPIKIDMVFLQDGGGFKSFETYIKSFGFSDRINIHLFNGDFSKRYKLNEYDMVLNIDTPVVFPYFENCENFYVECHTPYKENRRYLKTLPGYVRAVLVPSEAFRKEIRSEVPMAVNIFVLPNTISDIFLDNVKREGGILFGRRPLAYMARLDELKNISEALEIFREFKNRDDVMFMMVGKGATEAGFIEKLRKIDILGKSFIRAKVNFDEVPKLLNSISEHRGIFLSPSKGESFGMAVSESIVTLVPPVVSDIPAHRDLVNSDQRFLYAPGNTREAKEKIEHILDHWDDCSETMETFLEPLKHNQFVEAWNRFLTFGARRKGSGNDSRFEEGVRDHFKTPKDSRMYDNYLNYALSTNRRGESLLRVLSKHLKLINKSYLDIGTAFGGYLVAFAGHGCRPCIGIEPDENLRNLGTLNLAENGLDESSLLNADICKPLPGSLKGKKFDIITCTDVLEHVSDVACAIANMKELMAPGAYLYLDIPNPRHMKNIVSDPHFAIYGITLLEREHAKKYFDSLMSCDYAVSEYFELDYYLSFFPEPSYQTEKLHVHVNDKDMDAMDELFRNEIEEGYETRVNELAVPEEIKRQLIAKFSEYVYKYNSQRVERNIDFFYARNWRMLIRNSNEDAQKF